MYQLRTMMITLDLSTLDGHLIKYAFSISRVLEVDKIILMHVVKNAPLNSEVEYEGKRISQKEMVTKIIEKEIAENVSHQYNSNVVIEVVAGDPTTEILNKSKSQQVDLIIIGRKNLSEGSGIYSRKLTRRALCSVLTIPEKTGVAKVSKVLIPIDFSEYSTLALERSLSIAKKSKMEIICLNIYSLPKGYLSSGKTQEEFAEIMKKNAEKRYKHFIKKFDTEGVNISCRFQLDSIQATAKIIFNIALVEEADMIVIGSRGRTNIAAAFLGSTTEKLLLHNISIPTLVLKNKKQNLGFFEALLKL